MVMSLLCLFSSEDVDAEGTEDLEFCFYKRVISYRMICVLYPGGGHPYRNKDEGTEVAVHVIVRYFLLQLLIT